MKPSETPPNYFPPDRGAAGKNEGRFEERTKFKKITNEYSDHKPTTVSEGNDAVLNSKRATLLNLTVATI